MIFYVPIAEEIFIKEYIEIVISVPLHSAIILPANICFRGKRLLRTRDGAFTSHGNHWLNKDKIKAKNSLFPCSQSIIYTCRSIM